MTSSTSIACLDKFDKISDKIIDALATVIQTSGDENIILRSAEALGNINPSNKIAIDKLIDLIENNRYKYEIEIASIKSIKNYRDYLQAYEDISQYYEQKILLTAEILYSIAPENEISHNNLISLIQNSSDGFIRNRALNTLTKIKNKSLTKKIIIEFKQYLLPRKYENSLKIKENIEEKGILHRLTNSSSFEKHRTTCWHFEQYYNLIWLCSKQLSYPEFYQAWHQKNLVISLKRVWQEILFTFRIYK